MRRILKWLFGLGLVGLGSALLAAVALGIHGVPVPSTLHVEGGPKVHWSSAWSMGRALFDGIPSVYRLVGFDSEGRLLLWSPMGSNAILGEDGTLTPTDANIPWAHPFSTHTLLADGRMVYLVETNVQEHRALMLYEPESDGTRALFHHSESVGSFAVAPDETFVLFCAEDPLAERQTLYRQPLDEGAEATRVATFDGACAIQTVDATRATVLQSDEEKTSRLWQVHLATGERTLMFPEEAESSFTNGIQFTWYARHQRYLPTRDGELAYYVRTGEDPESLQSEFAVLWEHDVATGTLTQVSPELPGDIGHIALSPDERYLVYLVQERATSTLRVFNRATKEDWPLFARAGQSVDVLLSNTPFFVHPERNTVFFQTESVDGHRLFRVELDTRVPTELGDAPEPASHGVESITYGEHGPRGMTGTQAFLYKPSTDASEELPVLIYFHGGPDILETPYQFGLQHAFLRRGMAVLVPNYLGSAGYGVSFERADDRLSRHRQVKDAGALLEWIRSRPDLDGERVVLYGASWGGYMTLAALQEYPGQFLGGIAFCPVTLDPEPEEESILVRAWRRDEIGVLSDEEVREYLGTIAPATNAHRIQDPVMIVQGGLVPRVPVTSVRKAKDAIQSGGGDVWYIEAPEKGHSVHPGGILEGFYLMGGMYEFVDRLLERSET